MDKQRHPQRVAGVERVAVAGAGTMGPGIAVTFARAGYAVRLTDSNREALDKARTTVDNVISALASGGLLNTQQRDCVQRNLRFGDTLETALADTDLVVEAIPEVLDIKQSFFGRAEGLVRSDTILATNTSGLSVTRIAEGLREPARLVGMHWSNPPHLIPVVEVIAGERTSTSTANTMRAVVASLGLTPISVLKDVPGFVQNRILYAVLREALHLLESGVASAEDIDAVTKWGIGMKLSVIGPLELLDVAGLDIYSKVASYLNKDLSASTSVSEVVAGNVRAGHLGIKTGQGLFEYQADSLPALVQKRARLLLAARKALSE